MKMNERLKMLEGRLVADLQLSAEQRTTVRGIIQKYSTQRKEIRKRLATADKSARKAELVPLRQALRKEVSALLTPEQRKLYKTNKKTYISMLRNPKQTGAAT